MSQRGECRGSTVVVRFLGKEEVESSILSPGSMQGSSSTVERWLTMSKIAVRVRVPAPGVMRHPSSNGAMGD